MSSRLTVICEEDKRIVVFMNEKGVGKLGEYIVYNGVVNYDHLAKEISFTVAKFKDKHHLYCADFSSLDTKFDGMILEENNLYIVYFLGRKSAHILDPRRDLCNILKQVE